LTLIFAVVVGSIGTGFVAFVLVIQIGEDAGCAIIGSEETGTAGFSAWQAGVTAFESSSWTGVVT
jgi:hypothetical protein